MFYRHLFVNDDILNKLFNKEIKGDEVFLNESFQNPATHVYDEASFQSDAAAKQLKNIVSLLSKRAELPFYGGKFSLIIKKPHGKFKTVKYIIGGQGRQAIRFNLAMTGSSAAIYSIDFWNKVSKYPQFTIDVKGLNVVQLLDFIVDIIKHGKVGMKEEIFFRHGEAANKAAAPAVINEAVESVYNESVMEERAKIIKAWAGKNIGTYAQMKVSNVYHKFASEKNGAMDENQFRTSWRKVLIDAGFYAKQIIVQKGGTKEEIIVNAPKSAEESLGKEITGRIPAKEKFQQIKEYIKLVVEGTKKSFILTGDAGLGKAQPLYSQVKTSTGWKNMGDITIDDLIVGPDGRNYTIENIIPNQERMVFRIYFSDGRHVDAADDHMWKVFVGSWRRKKIKGKTEYIKDGYRTITTQQIKELLEIPTYKNKSYIPLSFPHNNSDVDLPIDPYVLGCIIGDGCISRKNQIGYASADQQIIDEIRNRLPPGMEINKHPSNKYGYSIVPNDSLKKDFYSTYGGGIATKGKIISPMVVELTNLGLMTKKSNNKFIPQIYKNASFKQKLDLLQGLLDTDGSINPKPGNATYCTVSKQLADDVRDILWSIGAIVNIKEKNTSFTDKSRVKKSGQKAYVLKIRYRFPKQLFKLERKLNRCPDNYQYEDLRLKINKVEQLGVMPVQCISISGEDNLYLTDNYIVTHNSFTVKQTLNKLGADYKFYKGSIVSAVNLYQVLFENNQEGKIVVLDDCDDILKDKAGVNVLKAALDTGEETRTISYMSQRMPRGEDGERLPTEFDYVGKVIFISNEYLKDMPGPLKSRAFKTEVNLTPTEIVDHIANIAFDIVELQKVPKPIVNECLQYMEKIAPAIGKFDIRSFTDVVANRLTGHKNWKAWAYESIKQSYGLA